MSATSTPANPSAAQPAHSEGVILLTAHELPATCPNPKMARWNSHPRVFIDITTTGRGRCPYCGTQYALDGPAAAGH